ncbi:Glycogenin-2 [Boothiomyces sp. JEL0838]|nr:Glycogenin-2 [Boothiomyces sp. JEL0838]
MTFAFATLLTSDLYLPGALVWLKSLKKFTKYPAIVIATKNLADTTNSIIQKQFDSVFHVDTIKSGDSANLELLGRPDLFDTFTKIHVFDSNLPFEKICFMDSDTLVLQNIDDVFDYIQGDIVFAAAPDIGWPDCFNSGVFVLKPDQKAFSDLKDFAANKSSGDQGLLNSYFCNWSTGSDGKTARLPFGYNVTPSTLYSYLPAFNHFKDQIRYAKPEIQSSFHSANSFQLVDQATQSFNEYKVDWNQNELGPYKLKLATKLATGATALPKKQKKEKSPNSISFYSTRPASPTKSQKSSASPTSIIDPVPVIKDINGMYEPGSVMTRVESNSELSEFHEYNIDWNPQELLGRPTAIPTVHDVKVNPLAGKTIIKTDSFTITPDGLIHYHD